MKLRTLSAAALVSLFVGGGVVSAAPNTPDPMKTDGIVTVEDGEIDPGGGGVTDPEDPSIVFPEVPGIKPNPADPLGALEVSHAPELDFGKIKTGNVEQVVTAKPVIFTPEGGSEITRGPILQFGDLRTANHGYTVTAKMDTQFSQSAEKLTGATITLTNPYAGSGGAAGITAPTLSQTATIGEDGETATIATAKNDAKSGKGMWAVEFGSNEGFGGAGNTTANSVILTVPASTASTMAGGNYKAVIEWAINSTPGS